MPFSEGYKPEYLTGLYSDIIGATNESFNNHYTNGTIEVGGISTGHMHAEDHPDMVTLFYHTKPDKYNPTEGILSRTVSMASHHISTEQVENDSNRPLQIQGFAEKPLGQKLADIFYTLSKPLAGDKISANNSTPGTYSFTLDVPYGSFRKGTPVYDHIAQTYDAKNIRLEHYPREKPTWTQVNIDNNYFLTPTQICKILYAVHGPKSPRRIEDLASSLGVELGESKAR